MDITKDNFYPNTERTTLMKCELLDLQGLVQLKNSLVKGNPAYIQSSENCSIMKESMFISWKRERHSII